MRPLSFEQFVRSETAPLLRLAYLLTHDASDAEDLVQEVLLSSLRQWEKVESAARPGAYVRRMLVNYHISASRRRRASEVAAGAEILSLNDRETSAAVSAEDRVDAWHWAMGVIGSLPPKQQAVLVLRYYEGLDDEEIGDMLGLGRSSVRSLAARAFRSLRAHPQLAHYDDPSDGVAGFGALERRGGWHANA